MWLLEIKSLGSGHDDLQIGKQYVATEFVGETFLINEQYVVFSEEVKLIGILTDKLNYHCKGKDCVEIIVFQFYDRPDYILSIEQFIELGRFDHIFVDNEVAQEDIKGIIYGRMSERQFNSLEAWEG